MKAEAAFIQWHRAQPVTSADYSKIRAGRLATAGGDTFVRIWDITAKNEQEQKLEGEKLKHVNIEFCSTLVGHSSGVNVVRWSPKEDLLASGDDGGAIVIWRQMPKTADNFRNIAIDEDTETYTECWKQMKLLTGHKDEVSDLAWSPCGKYIASVGTDQKLYIWDLKRGEQIGTVQHHTEVVQGVSWDPKGEFITTQSIDRYTNIYAISFTRIAAQRNAAIMTLMQRSTRIDYWMEEANVFKRFSCRLYNDSNVAGLSFYRRPAFSPDGNLLACVAGQLIVPPSDAKTKKPEQENIETVTLRENESTPNAVIVYTRAGLSGPPAYCYGGQRTAPWVVRFSPILYQLKGTNALVDLPYRMVLAVGTGDELLLYDTESHYPIASIQNFHVYRYQDIAWSLDGTQIIAASHDGYCTVVTFHDDELGERYEQQPQAVEEAESLIEQMEKLSPNDEIQTVAVRRAPLAVRKA